tara:strand:- start:167921 stop:168841 length:921 start_codon:yes stop_codon:yes gene_type:complete
LRRLNYNQLYYFYIIASLGSIKDACEKLHLTQPTISGQLKALEEDLGYKLFDRKYRKLILNDMGKIVFNKIEKVFLASEELAEVPLKKNQDQTHHLRVGILKTVPNTFVNHLYKAVSKHKGIKITIKTGHLEGFVEMLNKDQLDIVLSDTPYTCLKNKFNSLNLGSHTLCAVGTKKFLPLRDNFPNSLSGKPFLHYTSDNTLREELEMFFNFNNLSPEVHGMIDDVNLLVQMIKEGDLISIVPKESVASDIDSGELANLGDIESINLNRWAIMSQHSQKKAFVTELLNDLVSESKEASHQMRELVL